MTENFRTIIAPKYKSLPFFFRYASFFKISAFKARSILLMWLLVTNVRLLYPRLDMAVDGIDLVDVNHPAFWKIDENRFWNYDLHDFHNPRRSGLKG